MQQRQQLNETILERGAKPTFVECGCCGGVHRVEFDGDCRNDAERYDEDELDAIHGRGGWDLFEADEDGYLVEVHR